MARWKNVPVMWIAKERVSQDLFSAEQAAEESRETQSITIVTGLHEAVTESIWRDWDCFHLCLMNDVLCQKILTPYFKTDITLDLMLDIVRAISSVAFSIIEKVSKN